MVKLRIIILVMISVTGSQFFNVSCTKDEPKIKFPNGTFPDSTICLQTINTIYDDYNSAFPPNEITGQLPIIFSSNRGSQGGQFDLVVANISYTFDQMTGAFEVSSAMSSDPFLAALVAKANTTENDLGPNRIFNSTDGYEYLITTSQNATGNLDLFYMRYMPQVGISFPAFTAPVPVKLLNSGSNDGYLTFDNDKQTVYFNSDRGGNFDIYFQPRPVNTNIDVWFKSNFVNSIKADSINTSSEDKCPFIYNDIMILSSNRPGGLGGFDLYYSRFIGGKWNTPVNLGPSVNSSHDEFRPVIGAQEGYTNMFIVFSSDRPGGKGGFDLYFTGFDVAVN